MEYLTPKQLNSTIYTSTYNQIKARYEANLNYEDFSLESLYGLHILNRKKYLRSLRCLNHG